MGNADRQVIHTRIHVIPTDVCRKICTGQVIITLAGACKELIDNALDAQAKTIGLFIIINNKTRKCYCIKLWSNYFGIVLVYKRLLILLILVFD